MGVIILWALLCDYIISSSLKHNHDRRFMVWTDIQKGGIDADVLIMGSSRAWVQFSPKIIDSLLHVNSYNLGIDGSHIDRQILRYDIYRAHNKKPKLILQNIDFISTLTTKYGYEREQFFPYMFFDLKYREKVAKIEPFKWYELHVPFVRYYGYTGLIKEAFAKRNNDELYKGYHGFERTWDGSNLLLMDSLSFRSEPALVDAFIQYVEQGKKEGIDFVFVYAPFYVEAVKKVTNLNEMYAVFDTIANVCDVPILDYTFSYLSYDTTYFYNASHLNKNGSELFSIMLANDLDSLGIINNCDFN